MKTIFERIAELQKEKEHTHYMFWGTREIELQRLMELLKRQQLEIFDNGKDTAKY